MRKTEPIELTVLCLIEDGDRILLQNRVKNDWHGYALPGGHVEPAESIVDAVIREMKEETGLTVLSPRLVGVKQFPIESGRSWFSCSRRHAGQGSSNPRKKVIWSGSNTAACRSYKRWTTSTSCFGSSTTRSLRSSSIWFPATTGRCRSNEGKGR